MACDGMRVYRIGVVDLQTRANVGSGSTTRENWKKKEKRQHTKQITVHCMILQF